MIVELNLTQIIFLALAFASALGAGGKLFYGQFERGQDQRFKAQAAILERNQEAHLKLEREMLQMQAEIPRLYLRREDYLREAQALHESIRAEIAPIRVSVNRIEDFLINK